MDTKQLPIHALVSMLSGIASYYLAAVVTATYAANGLTFMVVWAGALSVAAMLLFIVTGMVALSKLCGWDQ